MVTYLSSAFSFNMIDLEAIPNGYTYHEVIDANTAASLASGATNVIGHADTASVVGNELFGNPLPANRVNVAMGPGDEMIVAQYIGTRLPEGATRLPEGATIKYILVRV